MTVANLLALNEGNQTRYRLNLEDRNSGIEGAVVTLLDHVYSGISREEVWSRIRDVNGLNDGICYVATATVGNRSWTYVGKTLNTMAARYPNGPEGGLGVVFDRYAENGTEALAIALYNVSNPALVEGWCYQVATDRAKLPTYILTNIQDPS